MNGRRKRNILIAWVVALCLVTGTTHAIYKKSISLTGTVTLVYTAPTEAPLDAEDYLQMAKNAHENSKPIFTAVRNIANGPVGDMLWGNGSFQKAYETANAFSWQKPELMKDPAFAMQRSDAMSKINAWQTLWGDYRQEMYAIARAMEAKGIETNKNKAVSAYNDFIHAEQWHKDPVASFEALKSNALAAHAKYLEVVTEKQAIDAKVDEMINNLEEAWQLVSALQNYNPANNASQSVSPSSTLIMQSDPASTSTLQPENTLEPTPAPTPTQTTNSVQSPTSSPTLNATMDSTPNPTVSLTPNPTVDPMTAVMLEYHQADGDSRNVMNVDPTIGEVPVEPKLTVLEIPDSNNSKSKPTPEPEARSVEEAGATKSENSNLGEPNTYPSDQSDS
jgi:hypothetical protein